MTFKALVTDMLADSGLDILRAAKDVELDYRPGLKGDELLRAEERRHRLDLAQRTVEPLLPAGRRAPPVGHLAVRSPRHWALPATSEWATRCATACPLRPGPRRSQVGSGGRSEKIRTYNFKENRVTDHRIGLTQHNLDAVLAGDLDSIVTALMADERRRQLEDGDS